jgi:putative transposase
MNAHAEQWVGSVRREHLDHFLVFGEKHLLYFLGEYLAHYNGDCGSELPHQGLGNIPLSPLVPGPLTPEAASTADVVCRQRLGGLVKHYYHQAA